MRRLHPVGRHESQADEGVVRGPGGRRDAWTVHALPEGRHVVRVEEGDGALWHLALDAAGRPERLQTRWREAGRTVEATLTFFDDEVLIWRRGAEPASEAVPMARNSRLLWPPIAGRDWCLAGVAQDGAETLSALHLERLPATSGGLALGRVELAAERAQNALTLAIPGQVEARLELDPTGRLRAWRQGDILCARDDRAG